MLRYRAALLAIGLLTLSSGAWGADPKNVKEAERRFKEGQQLMSAGRVDDARVQFAEANALIRSTAILWNLIGAEFQSSHYADALNHARQFVRDPKAAPKDIEYLNTKVIPEAAQQVGQLDVEAPAGAQIEIDAKEKAGHAPLLDAIAVTPGAHQVIAITPNDRLTKDVTLKAGETLHVVLGTAAVPAGPAAASAAATLDVSSMLERAPQANDSAPSAPRDDADEARRRSRRYWVSGSFAAGAILFAAGSATFYFLAKSSHDDADEMRARLQGTCPNAPGCGDLTDTLHSQNVRLTTSYVLLGGAAASAIGAGLSWWLLRPEKNAGRVGAAEVVPVIDGYQRGFAFRGSF